MHNSMNLVLASKQLEVAKKVQKNSVPETYTYIGYPQVNDYIYVIHRSRITLQIRIFVDFC